MSNLEERFSYALHNTARAWRHALDRRLKGEGLGLASWLAIARIAMAKQPPSQIELADLVGVEAPTMVSTIDKLVKAQLVVRVPSDTDRRVKLVVLTESGQELYTRIRAQADAYRKELLRKIDKTKLQETAELLEMLQERIASAL
jgi:MarR family transcriptional regulator for hemolysin